jgi:hypothetical protein
VIVQWRDHQMGAGQFRRQICIASDDGSDFVATADRLLGDVAAYFAGSGDEGDFHHVLQIRE